MASLKGEMVFKSGSKLEGTYLIIKKARGVDTLLFRTPEISPSSKKEEFDYLQPIPMGTRISNIVILRNNVTEKGQSITCEYIR